MNENSITTGLLSELSVERRVEQERLRNESSELGQDTFLQLMITQLENQDPLNPQEGADFVAQLAQLSTVEGIGQLNDTTSALANSLQSSQALQASSLVGRDVRVQTSSAELSGDGGISGAIRLPFSTNSVEIRITNEAGEVVNQQLLGGQEAGDIEFNWDGTDLNGDPAPDGRYGIQVLASTADGRPVQVPTVLAANVNSVTVSQTGGLTLNIEGIGPLPISSVEEIL